MINLIIYFVRIGIKVKLMVILLLNYQIKYVYGVYGLIIYLKNIVVLKLVYI